MAAEAERAHMGGKPAAYVDAADMVLEVQGRRFAAHSLVLRESPVLSDMLDALAPAGGPSAPEGTANYSPSAPMVLNLSGPDGKARLPRALTADAMAALLELLYHPWRPMLQLSGSTPRVLLAEGDAQRLIPAADFFGMRSVLELCDIGLAARLAQTFSWTQPCAWTGPKSEGPVDQRWLKYGERYALPHVVAVSLDSVLHNLTRPGAKSAEVQANVTRLQESISGATAKVIAEETVAYVAALGMAGNCHYCRNSNNYSRCNSCGNNPQMLKVSSYKPDTDAIAARLKVEMVLA